MPGPSFVFRKPVDWSLLLEGVSIPQEMHAYFLPFQGRLLQRGESKAVRVFLGGKVYSAQVTNVGFKGYAGHSDVVQIRYQNNGELDRALQACFSESYTFLLEARSHRQKGDKTHLRLPEGREDTLNIYPTTDETVYLFEPCPAGE